MCLFYIKKSYDKNKLSYLTKEYILLIYIYIYIILNCIIIFGIFIILCKMSFVEKIYTFPYDLRKIVIKN